MGELGPKRAYLLFPFTGPNLAQTAPSFSSVLKDSVVIEGQDFVLRCSVQGTPAPRVTWLLNGEFPLAPVPVQLSSLVTPNHMCLRRAEKGRRGNWLGCLLAGLAHLLFGNTAASLAGRLGELTSFTCMKWEGEIPAQRYVCSSISYLMIRLLREHR